jgi:beta-hydroxylase
VGAQTRTLQEGGTLVFDDTAEHEAWNYADGPRTVLLFDFLRPGHTADELDEMPPEVAAALHRRTAAAAPTDRSAPPRPRDG